MFNALLVRASPHTRGWTRAFPQAGAGFDGFPAHAGMDPRREGRRGPSPGLPRTRGDGPCEQCPEGQPKEASPHTRGWTRGGRSRPWSVSGFPAHAGMDRDDRSVRAARTGLPRTRGDGPLGAAGRLGRNLASPHTRGWTVEDLRADDLRGGFPAHAGMDLRAPPASPTRGRLPRTRGDGPRAPCSTARRPTASPHTRGWTARGRGKPSLQQGFPAHAGMDPGAALEDVAGIGLPRTRGDGPRAERPADAGGVASPHTRGWTPDRQRRRRPRQGFPAHAGMDHAAVRLVDLDTEASPHTRGWTLRGIDPRGELRGFPAHAGMDPASGSPRRPRSRLPRTRGDGPSFVALLGVFDTASPHTRGWTRGHPDHGRGRGGFPAHAGMDPRAPAAEDVDDGLPRTRGDGPRPDATVAAVSAASPHTRGWTPGDRCRQGGDAGFPAHAGMDRTSPSPRPRPCGLPRTRGDGPAGAPRSPSRPRRPLGFPAHAGMDPERRGRKAPESGFPAHAGMDRGRPWTLRETPGLPRTRGDGPVSNVLGRVSAGASPHTRGWTLRQPAAAEVEGGFPAHAGMDLE